MLRSAALISEASSGSGFVKPGVLGGGLVGAVQARVVLRPIFDIHTLSEWEVYDLTRHVTGFSELSVRAAL